MAERSQAQRLFGAACLKVQLEQTESQGDAIYRGALEDLGLTDAQVEEYLQSHRDEVIRALKQGRQPQTRGELP